MRNPWTLAEPLLVDRSADRRDSGDLASALAVVVRHGALLTREGRLELLEPEQRPEAELVVYLGFSAGRDIVAVVPTAEGAASALRDGLEMTGLREHIVFTAHEGSDGPRDRELGATAVALATWHENHPRCSVCGRATEPRKGGWIRYCEHDEREHYPRTDPAVIVAITDPEDRLLIAHASYWSPRRFSHLAGYVEPGESLEQAAHREVAEEAGLRLTDLTYVGSQPWPFPASIMVGFTARVADATLTLDDDEITEARFVSREELAALAADGTIVLAPAGSIARRMIEDWYGGQLD
jgi:NAD+ diphosphatase